MEIEEVIFYLDSIYLIRHYVNNLSSQEDRLRAIKAINEKAKNHDYSDSMRENFLKLGFELMNEYCAFQMVENHFRKLDAIQRKDYPLLKTLTYFDEETSSLVKDIHLCQKILNKIKKL